MTDTAEFKAKFQRLLELREARDVDKSKSKKSEAAYREYESELWEELSESGISGSLKFDFGDMGNAAFVSRSTIYGSVVDKKAAIASLKKLGLGDAINDEAIREGRLNEIVRDYMETGQELPDGVSFYPRKGISISRK